MLRTLLLSVLVLASVGHAAVPLEFTETTTKNFLQSLLRERSGPRHFAVPAPGLLITNTTQGKFRPLTDDSAAFLNALDANGAKAFPQEMLVQEKGGQAFWMPVRGFVVPEVRKASMLVVRYVGRDKNEAVFVVLGAGSKEPVPDYTWRSLCASMHCTDATQKSVPLGIPFHFQGSFTGNKRTVSSQFGAFLDGYANRLPAAFKIPSRDLARLYEEEAEFRENGSDAVFWIPLPPPERKTLQRGAAVRLYGIAYGSVAGRILLIGVESKRKKPGEAQGSAGQIPKPS